MDNVSGQLNIFDLFGMETLSEASPKPQDMSAPETQKSNSHNEVVMTGVCYNGYYRQRRTISIRRYITSKKDTKYFSNPPLK